MEDGPFGPWRHARTDAEVADAQARPLFGHWLDEFAIVYEEAFSIGGALPPEIDALPIHEVAMILGRNRVEPREAWPADGPDIASVRRAWWRRKGLRVPAGPPDDDEYADLLAQVKGGRRVRG